MIYQEIIMHKEKEVNSRYLQELKTTKDDKGRTDVLSDSEVPDLN